MIKAVIFDMDGLLIDSESFWRQAHMAVLSRHGYYITEQDIREKAGIVTKDIVEMWRQRFGWDMSLNEEITQEIISEVLGRVKRAGTPLPGATHAVRLCKQQALPLAVASSSPPELIQADLECMKLVSYFDVVHSAVHERRGKPYPDVFLSTAKQLGIEPDYCLVFEDSLTGVKAAKAAGMRCVAVPHKPYDKEAFAIADGELDSLEQLSPQLITSLG